MSFKINFSEFDRLKKSYSEMSIEFDDFLKDFLIKMAEKVIEKTKKKQAGEIGGGKYQAYDTGTMTNSWIISEIGGKGKQIYAVLHNSVEYATDIEYGHRIMGGKGRSVEVGWYEGRFMLKTSINEVKRQMPLRFSKEFERFCKRMGINAN